MKHRIPRRREPLGVRYGRYTRSIIRSCQAHPTPPDYDDDPDAYTRSVWEYGYKDALQGHAYCNLFTVPDLAAAYDAGYAAAQQTVTSFTIQ